MASEFTLPITAEGAVTAPTGVFNFVEPSAKSQTFLDVGPASMLEIPEFGFAFADGVNPLRLAVKGSIYDCGGIAPNVSLTAAGTGARATLAHTFATEPNDADEFRITTQGGYFITVKIVAALTTTTDSTFNYRVEVKTAGSRSATLARIALVINGSASVVEGTHFHWRSVYLTYAQVIAGLKITASDVDPVITYQATTYGVVGNSYVGLEITDGGADWNLGGAAPGVNAPFTGGTDSTGSAPAIGTFRYFFTWYRAADGAETGRSPIVSYENGAVGNVNISGLTASADTTYDYIRIYRTTNLGVEFYLVGAVPRASSTFTDDVLDTVLAVTPPWNALLYRAYAEGSVPRGRALAYWKGRMWSLGARLAADYVKGTVAVLGKATSTTTASATITFSAKGPTALMRNRTFIVDATSEEYTIISVSESGPTAVLDRVYEGVDNATATFKIKDDYDASRLRASVQFLYNQWPVNESPGRVDTDDEGGGTALLATESRLFAFSPTSIVAVTGEGQESWTLTKIGQGVGCVAPRLLVGVAGGGVFLSPDGFYAISPDGALSCISTPKAQKKQLAQGIDGTVARIAWANVDQGYSYYDTTNRTVVFGLPLDGAVVPNYEIVFDLQNSTWTTFKRAEWTAGTNATLPGGGQFILAGDRTGNLWHDGIGESDGHYGAESVATLTGAQTVRALTASGAAWVTTGDGEKGKPFIVLYADGVTVAHGKVGSNTGTVITPEEDLSTAPAASDQIVLGCTAPQAKTGQTTFGEEYRVKSVRSVTLRHAPATRNVYFLSFSVDGGTFSLPPVGTGIGTLSTASGKVRHYIQWPGDSHAFNIRIVKPGGRAILRGGVFDLIVRENARV